METFQMPNFTQINGVQMFPSLGKQNKGSDSNSEFKLYSLVFKWDY